MKLVSTKTRLPPFRLRFGVGFIVFFAVIYFFDDNGLFVAMLPVVLVHEMAHMAALISMGSPPRALNATLSGFSMDYSGQLNFSGEIISALSGPFAGLALAWLCAVLGRRFESEYLLLTAGIGFVLNAFNLLPAKPLDGGRALSAVLGRVLGQRREKVIMLVLGIIISLALTTLGVFFFARGMGLALIPTGLWLLVAQKNEYL